MVNKRICNFFLILLGSMQSFAQVAVKDEPRHYPIIVNQFLRVLDVWIPPGDTTLFHIHATPSLFLQFTNTHTATQIKDSTWDNKGISIKGRAYYEDFSTIRVHRVSNQDKNSFHVTDIEILSAFQPNDNRKPLPFTLLFDNDKAFAYRITVLDHSRTVFQHRGPIIAAMVEGKTIFLHEEGEQRDREISTGKFAYIKPGNSFYLWSDVKQELNLVLFELK